MPLPEYGIVSISHQDWSLHRKGAKDEARHNQKVKEAIKDNLPTIVSDGAVISADPKTRKTIRVPIRSVELPHIIFKKGNKGVGSGDGDEKDGDIIGVEPKQGSGKGQGVGDQPGVEYYETDITIEELRELVFQDLGLPFMQPKTKQEIATERFVFEDVRKKRSTANLDIMRTFQRNMERRAIELGNPRPGNFIADDLRVRTYREEIKEEESAVVISMADVSGSMGEFEKYITKSFCWWTKEFLESEFPKVERVFIAHHSTAWEVPEEKFFQLAESGGTKVSYANELAVEIIKSRFPIDRYNIYVQHFSDGDNWGEDDNDRSLTYIREMLNMGVNQYAYIQIGDRDNYGLLAYYRDNLKDPRFYTGRIGEKADLWPRLQEAFDKEKKAA